MYTVNYESEPIHPQVVHPLSWSGAKQITPFIEPFIAFMGEADGLQFPFFPSFFFIQLLCSEICQ